MTNGTLVEQWLRLPLDDPKWVGRAVRVPLSSFPNAELLLGCTHEGLQNSSEHSSLFASIRSWPQNFSCAHDAMSTEFAKYLLLEADALASPSGPQIAAEIQLLSTLGAATQRLTSGLIHDLKSSLAAEGLLLQSLKSVAQSPEILAELLTMLVQANEQASERAQLLQWLCATDIAVAPNAKRCLQLSLAMLSAETREAVVQSIEGNPGAGTDVDARALFRALIGLVLVGCSGASKRHGASAQAIERTENCLEFYYQGPCEQHPWQRLISAIAESTEALVASGYLPSTNANTRLRGLLSESLQTGLPFRVTIRDQRATASLWCARRTGFVQS